MKNTVTIIVFFFLCSVMLAGCSFSSPIGGNTSTIDHIAPPLIVNICAHTAEYIPGTRLSTTDTDCIPKGKGIALHPYYILTAQHVVETLGRGYTVMTPTGQEAPIEEIRHHPLYDLAVAQVAVELSGVTLPRISQHLYTGTQDVYMYESAQQKTYATSTTIGDTLYNTTLLLEPNDSGSPLFLEDTLIGIHIARDTTTPTSYSVALTAQELNTWFDSIHIPLYFSQESP